MERINLTLDEKEAIRAIDENELKRLTAQAIVEGRAGNLDRMPLARCGEFVDTHFNNFKGALAEYAGARSADKISRTKLHVDRESGRLSFAVHQMKGRLEEEERNAGFFYIDDDIRRPRRFTKDLSVRVGFQYRTDAELDWSYGSIVFTHTVRDRLNYAQPETKRKPSASKQEELVQQELARTWEHLANRALCELRDFFRAGGNGAEIPEAFEAIPDPHDGHLTNFSTDFSNRRNKR